MDVLVMAVQFLMAIAVLVVVHEFGHFIFARMFGIKVEKFYLFMDAWGVKLFKYNYKGCEYGMGWLPLGGYVKIAGMVDESMDKEQAQRPVEPTDFCVKPVWQRALVMLGGVIFNVIFATLILWVMNYTRGATYTDNTALQYGIYPGKLAEKIGFKKGDKLLKINGKEIHYLESVLKDNDLLLSGADILVERDGRDQDIVISDGLVNMGDDEKVLSSFIYPRMNLVLDSIIPDSPLSKSGMTKGDEILKVNDVEVKSVYELRAILQSHVNQKLSILYKAGAGVDSTFVQLGETPLLGCSFENTLPVVNKKYGLFEALGTGITEGGGFLVTNAKALGKVVSGKVDAQKSLSGPVGIAGMFGGEFNVFRFWFLTAMLSLALALFNVLPIPALDGGHLVLLGVEAIMRKPLPLKLQYRIQTVGFVIMMALFAFIMYSDIFKALK